MFSLHDLSSASEAGRYYESVNDYYAPEDDEERVSEEKQEIEDEVETDSLEALAASHDGDRIGYGFHGKGAQILNLGNFDHERFKALLEGKVDENTQLGRRYESGKVHHRPGWDGTLSAPKSVSIMALVQGDVRLVDAHEKAVSEVHSYMEKHLAFTRDNKGELVKTNNLIFASFTETASRNLDAQLHTHNVVMNATLDHEGRWKSLEPRPIYKSQLLIGKVYRNALEKEVKTLGYSVDRADDGFEISGVPQALMDLHSSRSKEIAEAIEKTGSNDAKSKEEAALKTRRAKQKTNIIDLKKEWHYRSQEYMAEIENVYHSSVSKSAEKSLEAAKEDWLIHPLALKDVRLAIDHYLEYESVFSADNIHGFVLSIAQGQYNSQDIDKAINHLIEKKEILPSLLVNPEHTEYTTKKRLSQERKAISRLKEGKEAYRKGIYSEKYLTSYVKMMNEMSLEHEKVDEINPGQEAAIKQVLATQDQYVGIQGYAGVGKTHVWKEISSLAKSKGYSIKGFAPTGSAAEKLETDTGIRSQTIDAFIFQNRRLLGQRKQIFSKKEIWVMDESSLGNGKHILDIMSLAHHFNARVVFQGDKRQLSAVGWGKLFELMQQNGMATANINKIYRQKTKDLQEAVQSTLDRNYSRVTQILKDSVFEEKDPIRSLVNKWSGQDKEEKDRSLIVIPDIKSKDKATKLIRSELKKTKELESHGIEFSLLRDARLSDSQKIDGRFFKKNHIIKFNKDIPEAGINRGDIFTVTDIYDKGRLEITRKDGKKREVDTRKLKLNKFSHDVFTERKGELSKGDKIKWNRTDKSIGLKNGYKGSVKNIDEKNKKITVEWENGKVTEHDNTEKHTIDYNYVNTAFIAQGQDEKNIFAVLSEKRARSLVNEKSFYVTLTRARHNISLFTESKNKLSQIISRPFEKTSALEVANHHSISIEKNKEKVYQPEWITKLKQKVGIKERTNIAQKENAREQQKNKAKEFIKRNERTR